MRAGRASFEHRLAPSPAPRRCAAPPCRRRERAAFSTFASCLSTAARSASASSVLIVSMSETGSTLPATCTTLSSSKQRTTCAIASVSRMLARNWLPRPSPFDAPATRPAMSTNSTTAGITFSGFAIAASAREARVGHLDDADVGLDRAERIVLRGDARLGERVEERRLADVGQADDAAFEAHCDFRSSRAGAPARFRQGFPARVQRHHRALHVAGRDRRPRAERALDRVVDRRRAPRRAAASARSRRPPAAGAPSRADGRCRGAAARSRACPAAPGCRAGRCGRRRRRRTSSSPRRAAGRARRGRRGSPSGAIAKKRASAATARPDRFMYVAGFTMRTSPAFATSPANFASGANARAELRARARRRTRSPRCGACARIRGPGCRGRRRGGWAWP